MRDELFERICKDCVYNVGTEKFPSCDHPKGPAIALYKCARRKVDVKMLLETKPDDAA